MMNNDVAIFLARMTGSLLDPIFLTTVFFILALTRKLFEQAFGSIILAAITATLVSIMLIELTDQTISDDELSAFIAPRFFAAIGFGIIAELMLKILYPRKITERSSDSNSQNTQQALVSESQLEQSNGFTSDLRNEPSASLALQELPKVHSEQDNQFEEGRNSVKVNSQNSNSTLIFLPFVAWLIIFAIWLSTEPYGYRVDSEEQINAALIFLAGAVVCIALVKLIPKLAGQSIEGKVVEKSIAVARMNLNEYLRILKSSNDEEVGLALSLATSYAYHFKIERGIDLYHPASALSRDPGLPLEFSNLANRSKAVGEMHVSATLLVWVHTLRAFTMPQLRPQIIQMWSELRRGVNHVESYRLLVEQTTNKSANFTNVELIPIGLSKEVLNEGNLETNANKEILDGLLDELNSEELRARLLELKGLYEDGLITKEAYDARQIELLSK